MSYNITLSSSMRSNLLSLRNIATQMSKTQNILSTGKKINNAIDNATSYYQARSLTHRAADLNSLLDSMSQGIQTIKAAVEGLESGIKVLEQAKAVVNEAEIISNHITNHKRPSEFISKGYTIIDSNNIGEIDYLLTTNTKFALSEDITLDKTLLINNSDILIDGNGYSLSVTDNASNEGIKTTGSNIQITNISIEYKSSTNDTNSSVISVEGKNAEVTLTNVKINNNSDGYGVIVKDAAVANIDKSCSIKGQLKIYADALFDGQTNTQYIIDSFNGGALSGAVDFTSSYYVGDEKGDFGLGKWYLPAIGELIDLYGTDYDKITEFSGNSGINGNNINTINKTLDVISKDVTAKQLKNWYWSSTERTIYTAWGLSSNNGSRIDGYKPNNHYVRSFLKLDNFFNPFSDSKPQIGDIVYLDKTWGTLNDYDKTKASQIAGIVCDVNGDGSVKIVNLTDSGYFSWTSNDNDVNGIDEVSGALSDIHQDSRINIIESVISPENNISNIVEKPSYDKYIEQYKTILNQYDNLIKDTSYQGKNLLIGNKLNVIFDENRLHQLSIDGRDISSVNIGIKNIEWTDISDIHKTIKELSDAINIIRNYSSELGNKLNIIQTRQIFTDTLVDVLEVGADKLVLADMNEVSAEYLMLQTRQQLAVNSLSLASQSAKSILSLF